MIDVRGTSTLVRDALQLYADTQAGRAAGPAKPLANDLAALHLLSQCQTLQRQRQVRSEVHSR